MPKKRGQSSAAPESETVIAEASTSAEPAKEPTPPIQVFYCGSQSAFFNPISEILITLFFFPSLFFSP